MALIGGYCRAGRDGAVDTGAELGHHDGMRAGQEGARTEAEAERVGEEERGGLLATRVQQGAHEKVFFSGHVSEEANTSSPPPSNRRRKNLPPGPHKRLLVGRRHGARCTADAGRE